MLSLVLFCVLFSMSGLNAQITPPNADTDAECGADCWDLFSWGPVDDGTGSNIPNYGEGEANDANCNTIIDGSIEYEGTDSNGADVTGTAFGANFQGTSAWTDTWTVTFGTSLTNPVFNLSALFSDSQIEFTDCNGIPISLTDISTGTVYAGGTFSGNDEVQLSGSYDCVIVKVSNDRNDAYTITVGTCLGAAPNPPCVECPVGSDSEYLSLTNRNGTGTGATADVELNGVLYGTAEVIYSDLSISEDLSGSAFGAFANGNTSGEIFVLQINLCEPIAVNQVDILGLETESIASIGTSLSGVGAAAMPAGLSLTQCGGANTMAPTGGSVTNTSASCANQGNGNYTVGGAMTDILYFRYENPAGGCRFDKATFRIGACVPDGSQAVPTCPLTYVTYVTDVDDYIANGPDFIGNDANGFQVMRDANGNFFDQNCTQIQNEAENGIAINTVQISPCAEVADEVECEFCTPVPPCVECPADSDYDYFRLTNYDNTTQTGDVELNGILVGTSSLIFSDLDINTDFSGAAFGAFDNDGGRFVMAIEFCEPTTIQQLDVLGLETESQTWVGTSISSMDANGIPSGLNLTKCGGNPDMTLTNPGMVVNNHPSCANQGNANFTLGQTVSTLYFRYENPMGGCRFDKATFRLGGCTAAPVPAIPTCPITEVTYTLDPDGYSAAILGGGTGAAFSETILKDANGNYFDFTCNSTAVGNAVTNMTALATVPFSPCSEIISEEDCNFCVPEPVCLTCPADTNYDYITLTGYDSGIQMGDVRLNGTVIGTSTLVFSDLDINTDFSGNRFGAFDNDGGVFVMRLDFCEPTDISQLDILGLETESQTWVGTSLNGVGMAGIPAGLNLTKCGGSPDMNLTSGNMVVNEHPSCANQGNANFTIGQTVSTLYFRYQNPDTGCRFDKATFRLGVCTPILEDFIPECDLTLVDEVVTLANGSTETNRLWKDTNGRYFDINSCPTVIPEAPVFAPVQEYRFSPCGVEQVVEICPVCIRPGLAKDIVSVASPAASDVPSNIDVTFKFTLQNYIGEAENLIINDNLTAIPGFVQAFPALTTVMVSSNATSNAVAPGANPAYNGTGNILNGTSGFLGVGDAIMVTMTAEFDASLVPNNIVNIAQGGGSRGGNPPVLDDSVAGTDPDPNNDGDPRDNGTGNPNDLGNGATIYFPSINTTKRVVETFPVTPSQGAGNVNARFELIVQNTGNVDLQDITLIDDLQAQLGSAFIDISFIQYAEITASTATTNPVLNPGFNDYVFETNIFDGTSGLLEPGQSVTVQFVAELDPNAPGAPAILENQTMVSGTGIDPVTGGVLNVPNTNTPFVVNDLSDDGIDPDDTNNDFAGTGQNDPTPLVLSSIGLAKSVTNVVQSATPGNLDVTYQLILGNTGNTTVTNLQITDNVAQQLGAAFIGLVSGPTVSGGGATINSNFNASFYGNILNGTTGSLAPGQTATATFIVEINPSAVADPMSLTNQATATVSTPSGPLSDLSDSGVNPESNNLGAMGDTGQTDDPTPIFGDFPLIIQAPMDISIETYGVGNTPLNDWIDNNGYINIVTPEMCQPAVITNDYTPESFVSDCSPYSGSATVNFFYSDACGNSYEFSATFTLEDNTAPSCVKPADLTIACDDPDFDETISSYAGYWGPVTDLSHPITIESTYSEDGFDDNGQQTIVWTFTDACGNSRQWDAVLTVTGDCTPALVVEQPADLDLDCTDTVPAAGVVATTTCPGGVVTVTDSETVTPMGCAGSFTIVRTYVVTDECDNSETVSQTITVTDNAAPTFSFVPTDASVACSGDMTAFGTPTAADACGSVTMTSVDTSTGGDACNGGATMTRTWTATDECGNAATASQTLTLSADNTAPVFTFVPADQTITCPTSPAFGTPTATDDCNGVTMTNTVTSTGSCPAGYSTTITWTATDACGNATTASQTITVNPEPVTPVLTVTPPTNYNLDCTDVVPGVGVEATTTCPDGVINVTDTEEVTPMGCSGSFTIVRTYSVSDNCGNTEIVTQTIVVEDNTAPVFTSVPASADVDCTAYPDGFGTPVVADACGSVTMTFEDNLAPYICDADFNITRTWTATDECGNVATASQTLTVWPDVEAPLFDFVPGNTTVTCGQAVEFGTPTISDACTGFTLTEEVTSTGACPDAYSTTITWTAVDGCGNASVQSQTITVLAAPAPVTLGFTFIPENQFVECGSAYEFGEPVCEGNCDAGFTINVEDFTTTSEVCANTQILTRRWTATDACDNAAIAEQVITIVDTTAPEFTNVPADKVVACGEAIIFDEPVALDLCGGVTLTYADETEWADCEGVAYSVTRNWTAADACGNITTFANTISVEEDVTAPLLSALEDKVITCSESIVFDTPVATDNCDDVALSYTDVAEENGCEIVHTRTWTATDGCNNATETVQTVSVIDDVAPTFDMESHSISMSAFAYQNWTAPTVVAFDECSNVETQGPFLFDYENGRVDYSWTTIDACGNKASVTLTVNVISINSPDGEIISLGLTTFPNPTGGEMSLVFGSNNEGTAIVTVTDVLGRTYLTQKAATYAGKNVVRLDLGNLPQGTYLVKVNDGTQELTDTFIKF